ncbi:MAG: hypothetical protein BJ554DRAFT_3727 [Olpidium bornovanus]|uniref:Uncharacterized protein n=1 Tax=Olpidium bornovanus TaxID=278681 RepID=A0A8H7ZP64_9FUNG|nr:MAG: hypothetical protein BJ554DRAFT_3727 [Olpidium bornovanus]
MLGVRQLLSEDDEEVCADIEEGRRVLGTARMLEERRVETGRLNTGAPGASQFGPRPVIGNRDWRGEGSECDGRSVPIREDLVDPEIIITVRRPSSLDDPDVTSAQSPWTVKRLFSMFWGNRSASSWRQLPEDERFGPTAGGDDRRPFPADSATRASSGSNEVGERLVLGSGSQSLAGIDGELAHTRTAARIGSTPRPTSAAGNPAQRPDSRASGRVFGRSPARGGAARKQPPEDIFGAL